jgi:hypothetical protein
MSSSGGSTREVRFEEKGPAAAFTRPQVQRIFCAVKHSHGCAMAISRRALFLCAAGSGLGLLAAAQVLAQGAPGGRRIALSGYDPVAYFTDGKPVRGSPEFWYAFDDVVYHFRSAEHRDKFAADPERFAPQYDGYCAGAVSRGVKTEPSPEAWLIANGRLYVFEFPERVPMFRKIIDEVAAKADKAWPVLRRQ